MNVPIRLKPGREKSVLSKHLWIFSGALSNPDDIVDGQVHPVLSSNDQFLAIAYFNKRCSIAGRILSFQKKDPQEAIQDHLLESIELRRKIFSPSASWMGRLVHAEADLLPGLIVDLYADVAVLQIATLGMERLREYVIEILSRELSISWIYERSASGSRKVEGLRPFEGTVWGQERDEVISEESGISYCIDIKHGQKTGFFLDQREMRNLLRSYAHQKRVLNCFCYSGGFSLAALKGGASFCQSIDVSQSALTLLERNLLLNGFGGSSCHHSHCADVFEFLRKEETLPYDIVVLDPPAFAKKPHDVQNALRGYREINSQALQKMPKGSLLLTCSCSYYIEEALFVRMLKEAALQAKRYIRILTGHHNSPDHPVSPFHPENEYLKSYLVWVS